MKNSFLPLQDLSQALHEDASNQDFAQFIKNIYQEQAARIIQRRFRRRHTKDLTINYFTDDTGKKLQWHYIYQDQSSPLDGREFSGEYSETLKTHFPSLKFFKKPLNTTETQRVVQLIKSGKWLELNFEDPDFERYLLQALQAKEISLNELATATLLYYAKEEFHDPSRPLFHQFPIGQGPYDVEKTLDGWTAEYSLPAETIERIHAGLSHVSPGESNYFTINFSHSREVALLYDLLLTGGKDEILLGSLRYPRMKELIKTIYINYVKRLTKIDEETRSKLIADIQKHFVFASVSSPELNALRDTLTDIITKEHPEISSWLKVKVFNDEGKRSYWIPTEIEPEFVQLAGKELTSRGGTQFFAQFVKINDGFPRLAVSPDYKPEDPSSPLFCVIMPTMTALSEIQIAIQQEHAILPYFTAGAASAELIRDLDENPKSYGKPQQSRVVELDPPDVQPTQKADNYPVGRWILAIHDIYHCWRTGHIPYKPLFRHLREVIQTATGKTMTSSMWNLTDMDFPARPLASMDPSMEGYRVQLLYNLFAILKFKSTDTASCEREQLLILIDMTLRAVSWQEILGFSVEKTLANYVGNLKDGSGDILNEVYQKLQQMQKAHEALKALEIPEVETAHKKACYYFHLLRFYLDREEDPYNADVICQLVSQVGISNLFVIDSDNSLQFSLQCPLNFSKESIRTLSMETMWVLAQHFPAILNKLEPAGLFSLLCAFVNAETPLRLKIQTTEDMPTLGLMKTLRLTLEQIIYGNTASNVFSPFIIIIMHLALYFRSSPTERDAHIQILIANFDVLANFFRRIGIESLEPIDSKQLLNSIKRLREYLPDVRELQASMETVEEFLKEQPHAEIDHFAPSLPHPK
ncbi:MAG: hypothetical protein K0S08_1345 [Gammaproteobacteria bacterium]|jgi:hypothetical protein|nr:hypothetical protein [Gammaproteobacteria bacterium]